PATLGEFASRFTGSSDLYEATGRRPGASINFITAHDGFTLRDLVSYNAKHNHANGEDGRDGENHNRSWNCGIEGPTDDPEVCALRERQCRNMIATLALSQGTPMLLHGDEIGRTQGGNNNAYCQDSALTWVDWAAAQKNAELLEFTRSVFALRRAHPVFRRRRFLDGRPGGTGTPSGDVTWFTPGGTEMTTADWDTGFARALAVLLDGDAIAEPGPYGERVRDDSFLLYFNAHDAPLDFAVPGPEFGACWTVALDCSAPTGRTTASYPAAATVTVPGRCLIVARRTESTPISR
ncbi:MAG: glycogen debranching enzyme, partial [Stackebrandtia sp.]